MANTIRDVLETQDWAKSFLRKGDQNGTTDMSGIQRSNNKELGSNLSTREFTMPVSRKVVQQDGENESVEIYDTDDPENKYRRRGVMQLLVALGIV